MLGIHEMRKGQGLLPEMPCLPQFRQGLLGCGRYVLRREGPGDVRAEIRRLQKVRVLSEDEKKGSSLKCVKFKSGFALFDMNNIGRVSCIGLHRPWLSERGVSLEKTGRLRNRALRNRGWADYYAGRYHPSQRPDGFFISFEANNTGSLK